jgi:hypothetical protein
MHKLDTILEDLRRATEGHGCSRLVLRNLGCTRILLNQNSLYQKLKVGENDRRHLRNRSSSCTINVFPVRILELVMRTANMILLRIR